LFESVQFRAISLVKQMFNAMSNTSPVQADETSIDVDNAEGMSFPYPVLAPDSLIVLIKANTVITAGLVKHLQKFGVDKIHPPDPEHVASAVEAPACTAEKSEALFGLPANTVANISALLQEGLFERDVTKLRDLMLTVGRKMLDPDYREFYAVSLGDIMLNLGVKLTHAMTTREVNGRPTLNLVTSYFEALNGNWSTSVKMLDLYAKHTRLANHAVRLSILSMAIADYLEYSRREVKDVGVLGLLGKLGLMKLSPTILNSLEAPNRFEQIEIMKAPQYSTTLLEQLIGLPQKISAVANQLCERGDGSGYPRGLALRNTSPLARIVATADCYLSLVNEKPFRPPVQPNAACVYLLQQVAAGVFERRAVTALIELIGCYPPGTRVELSDKRIAEVVGTSSRPGRPMVDIEGTDERIDLSEAEISITKSLADSEANQIADWRDIPDSILLELPF